jgi:uncharacterized protein YeaO (DUF488 family)
MTVRWFVIGDCVTIPPAPFYPGSGTAVLDGPQDASPVVEHTPSTRAAFQRANDMIVMKRAYDPASDSDGYRVLIDRLWPRGISKAKARIDAWEKGIAPSRELRDWYGHDPAKWPEFRKRYAHELRGAAAKKTLDELVRRATRGRVTLVYASRAGDISDAAVLTQLLNRRVRALMSHRHTPRKPARAVRPSRKRTQE